MTHLTRFEALKLAYQRYGSQQAMADALGITQPCIHRWLNQTKQLPAEYVLKAEADTGVSRHALRPDIYPIEHNPNPIWAGVDRRMQQGTAQDWPVPKPNTAGVHAA